MSILIPAYNAQKWIADTLRSALDQTWESKEIIVVDDGSTDRTLEVARRFEAQGVRVFAQENQGAAAARNKAFSLSRGEYIQWLDADDLLAPDKVARQMEIFQRFQNRRSLLSCAFGLFEYRYYRARFIPSSLWRDLSALDWLLCKLGENIYMQTATWLVSRELTEAAGPWNTALLGDDDGEYFCRLLLASDGTRFVPDAKVYYRTRGYGTLSYVGYSNRKLDAHWQSMQLHIRYLRSLEESERVRTACLTYLQNCLLYFYPQRPDIMKQMEQLASDMGGKLQVPRLSWKYSLVQRLFGWDRAKHFQFMLRRVRWLASNCWDKALFDLKRACSRRQLLISTVVGKNSI